MIDNIQKETEKKMRKTIDALHHDLSRIRTGRANTSLLEPIAVEYFGNLTPLNQLAAITISDSRTLLVTPWDKSAVSAVEKAILNADLGLNPATAGSAIRVAIPPLTEERRKDMIKVARNACEQGRIAIRNVRRDANAQFKELVKEKSISEDDERRANEQIQKLTDKLILEIDGLLADKEKDLMEI